MTLVRHGHCYKCGACCNINNFPKDVLRNPNIEFDEEGWCTHIAKDHQTCMIYGNRPEICIRWPTNPREANLFPQCTYYFILD